MPTVGGMSPELCLFLNFIRRLRFGRIERLMVLKGVPLQTPPPTIIWKRKFCAAPPMHEDLDFTSYCRKPAVSEFILEMYEMDTGLILSLDVQNGLPFQIEIAKHGLLMEEMKRR